jgi:hypothetical protein
VTVKQKSNNLFLKRIAKHMEVSFNSDDFFDVCESMMNHGGASNCFIYCSENRDFLVKNKEIIHENLMEFFESIGYKPAEYPYTTFGNTLDDETIDEILGFIYGKKVPEQGTACDWIVWSSVEDEIFRREEEISKRKWDR